MHVYGIDPADWDEFVRNYVKEIEEMEKDANRKPGVKYGYHPEGCIPDAWSEESKRKMIEEWLRKVHSYIEE